jgi:hypothetical protein
MMKPAYNASDAEWLSEYPSCGHFCRVSRPTGMEPNGPCRCDIKRNAADKLRLMAALEALIEYAQVAFSYDDEKKVLNEARALLQQMKEQR